jgi:hypothetical protein
MIKRVIVRCKRCNHVQRHSMTNMYYACCSHCKTSINVKKSLVKKEKPVRQSFAGQNEQALLRGEVY